MPILNLHSFNFRLAMEKDVKLLGFWPQSFSTRVNGFFSATPFIRRSLCSIVHGGKAIAESLIILEYIEETWSEISPLLPKDANQRDLARFWLRFAAEKDRTLNSLLKSSSERELEKAAKEVRKCLKSWKRKALDITIISLEEKL
ncbi:S-crystallin [Parasponia andersonii]|uniref:S-crystallin n=1 Tax=Parasponia andersonii TaxID=3476 RepID=A0A2P5AHW2_PARAD|nr:S-crystallin [Parasponia andersonii]